MFLADLSFGLVMHFVLLHLAIFDFFNFIFLGIEYQFDNMMALVTGPEQVVTAQGYILGASVLGFLLYPAAASCIKEKFWQIVVFAGALAGVICVFVIWQHISYGTILAAGCICFILIGMAGSAVHYYLSRAAAPEHRHRLAADRPVARRQLEFYVLGAVLLCLSAAGTGVPAPCFGTCAACVRTCVCADRGLFRLGAVQVYRFFCAGRGTFRDVWTYRCRCFQF